MRENFKRWPMWHIFTAFTFSPVYITPFFSKDFYTEEGYERDLYEVTWLFFNVTFINFKKKHDNKAGFTAGGK